MPRASPAARRRAALLGARAPGLRAQSTYGVSLSAGTEVRLRTQAAPEQRLRARVLTSHGDSLLLRTRRAADRWSYRLAELRALEVRGDTDHARGVRIGAGIGVAVGLVGGGIDFARGEIPGGQLITFTIIDGLFGAVLGYLFAPRGWLALPLPRGQ